MKNNDKSNLIYIDNKTGQYIQRGEPMEGMNIYNDLNYGDMIFVFKNTFYDLMLDEKEKIIETLHVLDKAEKEEKKTFGIIRQKNR